MRSIRARVLKACDDTNIEAKELIPVIKRITKEGLKNRNGQILKDRTLNTYRSVLLRYILERITDRKMQPWEAIKYLKKKNCNNEPE